MSKRLVGAFLLCLATIVVVGPAGAIAAKPSRPHSARPTLRRRPRIAGTPAVGATLRASSGRWVGATKIVYKWKRCNVRGVDCKVIRRPRAKHGKRALRASQYTLTKADLGHKIRVMVIASNRHGSRSATSRPTARVRRTTPATPAPGGSGTPPGTSPAPLSGPGLHVVGNHLEDASGQQVALHGTEITGSSYACQQNGGYGFSDTPIGDSLYAPMVGNNGGALPKNWTINSFVLMLNQDCWLGINGVSSTYGGQNYVNFVKTQVADMESYGIYPVLVFSEGEPGTDTPNWNSTDAGEAPMPDNDHMPLAWEELANTFKNDPHVIFRLYEEPYPNGNSTSLAAWKCWSRGDVQYGTSSDKTPPAAPTSVSSTQNCNPLNSDGSGHTYESVGMQSLINIIRGTGATNVIQVPGVAFANMLSCSSTESPTSCGFLDSADGVRLSDPLSPSQLMADTDNYPDSGQDCENTTCLNDTYAPVESVMPLDIGEAGATGSTDTEIQQFISWYDNLGQSYYGSQWETWADLISQYNGTPHSGWGTWYYDHISGATCSVSSDC